MTRAHKIADDYSVANLPPEIARALEDARLVRIEIAAEEAPSFWKLRGIAAGRSTSVEQAVARVRALRDEWD